jgi:hypothetical protein
MDCRKIQRGNGLWSLVRGDEIEDKKKMIKRALRFEI